MTDYRRHPEYLALLASVLENPLDDAPRWIIADWIQEAGDDERSEFTRVQLEIEPLRGSGCGHDKAACDCRYHTLLKREQELVGVCPKWDARRVAETRLWFDLPNGMVTKFPGFVGGDNHAVVSRGWVTEVRLTCERFMTPGRACDDCIGTGADRSTGQIGRKYSCEDCGHVADYTSGVGLRCVSCQSHRLRKWREKGCQTCNGTGRLPGVAEALFRAHPIERVVLTDRRPYYEYVYDSTEPFIPSSGRVWRWESEMWELFPDLEGDFYTEVAALAALSAALVSFGRGLAGLPPLPTVAASSSSG